MVIEDIYDIPTPTRLTPWGVKDEKVKLFDKKADAVLPMKPVTIVTCDGVHHRFDGIKKAMRAHSISIEAIYNLTKGKNSNHPDVCGAYFEKYIEPKYTVYYSDGRITYHSNAKSIAKYAGLKDLIVRNYLNGKRVTPLPCIDKIKERCL